MALRLSRAISDGFRRTFTRTGGILFVGLLIIQLGTQISVNSAVLGYLPPEAAAQFGTSAGLSLPVPGSVGLAMFGVFGIISSAYFVILSRTFAQPLSNASVFPTALTERLGRATLSALIGGFLVTITVMIGFVFLIIPGLFLAVSYLFFIFIVAVEDRGVTDSLKRSWALARGSRLKLSILVIVSGVFGLVLGAIAPLFDLAGVPVIGEIVSVTITTAFFLPLYAIIASAYLQLRDEQQQPDQATTEPVDASQTAKL